MNNFKWAAIITVFAVFALPGKVELFKIHLQTDFRADEAIRNCGYPSEVHEITTPDGYILTMQRIPNGKISSKNNYPVLIMHGMFGSADNFIVAGDNQAIVYYLAERGYDVWLGNARGNKYSRRHVKLDPDLDSSFWNFSWHEIGITDLPTKIDYILNKTKKSQLYYIGHSQGTTSFFVMASQRPEYSNKIKLAIQLAPSVFLKNLKQPFLPIISQFHYQLYNLAIALNINELVPNIQMLSNIGKKICEKNPIWTEFCLSNIFLLGGFDPEQFNISLLPTILSAGISSVSVKQPLHYAQGVVSGKFRQFDYGLQRNLKYYNSQSPPNYNLRNITTPIALLYGNNDWLSAAQDVKKLRKLLPNVVMDYLIPFKYFNHFDFLWAIDLVRLVHEPLYNLMKKYEKDEDEV